VEYTPVNLRDLNRFDDGSEVDLAALKAAGLIASARRSVKVLGDGDIDRKLTVRAHKFSMTAREKIEAAGGTAAEIATDGNGS
jgi:large subunit ribosomal protein L15